MIVGISNYCTECLTSCLWAVKGNPSSFRLLIWKGCCALSHDKRHSYVILVLFSKLKYFIRLTYLHPPRYLRSKTYVITIIFPTDLRYSSAFSRGLSLVCIFNRPPLTKLTSRAHRELRLYDSPTPRFKIYHLLLSIPDPP